MHSSHRFGSIRAMRCDRVQRRLAQPEGRSRLTHFAWFVLCLLLTAAVGLGCGDMKDSDSSSPMSGGPKPVRVEGLRVVGEEFVQLAMLTGQLEAEHSVLIKPETWGVVESVYGIEGAPVKKGEILFRLRDAEQRARLREAEAGVRLAADVYDRTERLSTADISSQARGTEAAANLDVARAKLERAKVDLERTKIRAPFDGVLGSRLVSPGSKMDEKEGMVTLDAIDRLKLSFTVPEIAVALARLGGRVGARVISYPDRVFPGEVFFISPHIEVSTRRLVIKAWIANDEHLLKPGMFANVEVEVARKPNAILLPEAAMVYDRHGIYVWREDEDGKARKVPVVIGFRQGGRVEVVEGVAIGDRVIVAGTHKVLAGSLLDFGDEAEQIESAGKIDTGVKSALEEAEAGRRS